MIYGAAVASAIAACGEADDTTSTDMTADVMSSPLTDLFAVEALAAMNAGTFSAEDYASALLEKAEEWADLNAWLAFDPDNVIAAARVADNRRASGATLGPLHGLPVPVKDSVNTRDYPTTAGTPALADFQPVVDAELVRRLRAAGAIVMGKTNLHELSYGWTSNNLAFGAVRNPYNTERIPGGSSGGTSAAIAARMAPIGIAADTQGSIRVPAALCGLCAYRPTQNRYPNQGVAPITSLFDQVGPHARSVSDLVLFDEVITGQAFTRPDDVLASLEGARLGVAREFYFEMLHPDVERITNDAIRKLADAGAIIVEVDVPGVRGLVAETTDPVQIYHTLPSFSRYLDESAAGLTFNDVVAEVSADIAALFAEYVVEGAPLRPSDEAFTRLRDERLPFFRQTMADYFSDNRLDGMILPCTQMAAPLIGQDFEVELNGRAVPFVSVMGRNVSPCSTTGIPGLVLPAGMDGDELPVSIEVDGPAGSDHRMLELGLAMEQVLGRLPPPTR